jgi:hypothetical protein
MFFLVLELLMPSFCDHVGSRLGSTGVRERDIPGQAQVLISSVQCNKVALKWPTQWPTRLRIYGGRDPILIRGLMVIPCMPGTIWMCKAAARKCSHRFITGPTPLPRCSHEFTYARLWLRSIGRTYSAWHTPYRRTIRGWPVTCLHKPPTSWQPVLRSWRSWSSDRRYSECHAFNYAH